MTVGNQSDKLKKIEASVLSFKNFLSEKDERALKEWKVMRKKLANALLEVAKYADHAQSAINSAIDIANMTGNAVVATRDDIKMLLKKCKQKTKMSKLFHKDIKHVDSGYLKKVLPRIAKMISKAKRSVGVLMCEIVLRWIKVTISSTDTIETLGELWHTFESIQQQKKEE